MNSDRTLRAAAWADLDRPSPQAQLFDADDLRDLPDPAQRLLDHTLESGTRLRPKVRLEMEGEIKLKTWTPFHARQILRAAEGFVWEAEAGSTPMRVTGGDSYWRGRGDLDFRLWGLIPVARASGPDVDRSAAGRLAAETVSWAPQALVPGMGASWKPQNSATATVTVPVGREAGDVDVTIDDEGRLREVVTRRWGDPDTGEYGFYPFGGSMEDYGRFDGVTIVTKGRIGWWWGTDRQDEGEFFRFTITDAWMG